MPRPELLSTFDHLTLDGLRSYILAVADYVAAFTTDGPEPRRYQTALDSAREIMRQRMRRAV